jgi:putative transposase
MANTYTQIHIQLVFAVRFRDGVIKKEWKNELYQYITEIIQSNKHKLLIINGIEDHIHILIGLRTHQSIASLVQEVKAHSSKWINEKRFLKTRFEWQEGYAAFSYTKKDLGKVIEYIKSQEVHHQKKPFRQEYLEMLKVHEVDYDERYLFNDLI